jgi:serine/threonine protein kinase
MASAASLTDLLLRWDDHRQSGQPRSASELCGSRADLIEPLRQRIRALESMEQRLGLAAGTGDEAGDSTEISCSSGAVWPVIPGYEILGVIDQGGMGIVYRARQIRLNRLVAVKMILTGCRPRADQLARFRAEAEAIARLQHPHVVQIYDVGQVAGRPFFTMELVEGGSLAQRLAGRRVSPADAAHLVETLARVIDYAHGQGIVHRDLKPANILVSGGVVSGEARARSSTPNHSPLTTHQVKITDFGLAKRLDAQTRHTQSGAIVGTPGYMAPEQAGGKVEAIGPAADIYALGAILYELLTGRPPFQGETALDTLLQVRAAEPVPPRRLQPRLPRDLETICLKCLEKKPERRYPSAVALADDLACFLQRRPIAARRSACWERGLHWLRRRSNVVAFAAVFLAALGIAATAFTFRPSREPHLNPQELAPQVRTILHKYCFECHGQDPERAERGLNVLDYRQLLDEKRRLVVPGAAADSRLIQRLVDESMPPQKFEELPRVGPEELQVLKDWIAGGAPPFAETDEPLMVLPQADSPLAAEVKDLFRERCYACHKFDNAQGGIKIMNHDLLVAKRKVIVPGRPQESELFRLISGRATPVMPPPNAQLTAAEIDLVRRYIEAGAPPFPRSR